MANALPLSLQGSEMCRLCVLRPRIAAPIFVSLTGRGLGDKPRYTDAAVQTVVHLAVFAELGLQRAGHRRLFGEAPRPLRRPAGGRCWLRGSGRKVPRSEPPPAAARPAAGATLRNRAHALAGSQRCLSNLEPPPAHRTLACGRTSRGMGDPASPHHLLNRVPCRFSFPAAPLPPE